MTTYAVIRRADQVEVYRYNAAAPIEWNGWPWTEYDNVLVPDPVAPPPPPPPAQSWTNKADFLRRFTLQERIAAKNARATDPIMDDFWTLLEQASSIESTDPDVQAGLNYMVQQGLLAAGRPAQILGAA